MKGSDIPALGLGVKFRFDQVRKAWVVLAPERMFVPDEQAVAILQLVDGLRSIEGIAAELAARYAAPQELIENDMTVLLGGLADKGVVVLR